MSRRIIDLLSTSDVTGRAKLLGLNAAPDSDACYGEGGVAI